MKARITVLPTLRSPHPCGVCGCGDVLVDEVAAATGELDGGAGIVQLSECTRCEHRWMQRRAEMVRVEPGRLRAPARVAA